MSNPRSKSDGPPSSNNDGERRFDLNLKKILEGWETSHALRELIANALDEQTLTNTKDVEIVQRGGKWVIRDYGRGLRCEQFTQNENQEKLRNSGKMIGKCGVGLKELSPPSIARRSKSLG